MVFAFLPESFGEEARIIIELGLGSFQVKHTKQILTKVRRLGMLSHLDHLEKLFPPLGRVHLGMCEHSNRLLMWNNTSEPKTPRKGWSPLTSSRTLE